MDYTSTVYSRLLMGTARNPGLPDPLATIMVGQSQHESDNYTSPVFQNSNNAFGYKYSGSRYQVGNYHGYGKYNSIDDSAAEMVDYVYRRVSDGSFPQNLGTIYSADQYAQLLQGAAIGPYYEDTESNYANGIESWLSGEVVALTSAVGNNPMAAVGVFAGLIGLAYLITKN